MKFADIQKLTREGHYQINIPIKRLPSWIQDHVESDGLEMNPDFQRGHVWTEEQQIAYVEFLLRGGQSGRTIYFNHPGWMGNFQGDFVCVDGLQRCTAICRFINNEIPVFGTLYKDFEDKLHSDPDVLVNINDLKTREEVLQWYLEMNTMGTPHTKEELERVAKLLVEEQNSGKN